MGYDPLRPAQLGRVLINPVAWRTEIDVRLAPKATRLLRGVEMTRWAVSRIRIRLISLARCVVQSSSKNLFLWWIDQGIGCAAT